MPHVVEPFSNASFDEAIHDLRAAHAFVVSRAKAAIHGADVHPGSWGIALKRTLIDLTAESRPKLIGKPSEKLGEVINITATIERLIAAMEWFARELPTCSIHECHPSTSDDANGNDLVLVNGSGDIVVRCEVCDVASSNAGSNGKEKKDIRNLGCSEEVPDDNVRRFICTAPEFATALTSEKRKWATLPYRYEHISVGDNSDCRLLLIHPNGK